MQKTEHLLLVTFLKPELQPLNFAISQDTAGFPPQQLSEDIYPDHCSTRVSMRTQRASKVLRQSSSSTTWHLKLTGSLSDCGKSGFWADRQEWLKFSRKPQDGVLLREYICFCAWFHAVSCFAVTITVFQWRINPTLTFNWKGKIVLCFNYLLIFYETEGKLHMRMKKFKLLDSINFLQFCF